MDDLSLEGLTTHTCGLSLGFMLRVSELACNPMYYCDLTLKVHKKFQVFFLYSIYIIKIILLIKK